MVFGDVGLGDGEVVFDHVEGGVAKKTSPLPLRAAGPSAAPLLSR